MLPPGRQSAQAHHSDNEREFRKDRERHKEILPYLLFAQSAGRDSFAGPTGLRYGRVRPRLLQTSPVLVGPRDHHRLTHHEVLGHRALPLVTEVVTGVRRVVPVVAKNEEPALGHLDVERQGGGFVPGVQVRLVQGLTVDGDAAVLVAALHLVTADGHDAFDEVLLVVGRKEADERQPLLELLDHRRVVGGR